MRFAGGSEEPAQFCAPFGGGSLTKIGDYCGAGEPGSTAAGARDDYFEGVARDVDAEASTEDELPEVDREILGP